MNGYENPRAAGLYDADAVSLDSGLRCEDPSLAIQSQKEEADINVIVERFGITGEVPVTSRVPFPVEVDLDEVLDYRTCMDALNRAQASFMSLPAKVRATFGNDPVAFAEYASDPQNLNKLREWGLAPKAPAEPSAPSPAAS